MGKMYTVDENIQATSKPCIVLKYTCTHFVSCQLPALQCTEIYSRVPGFPHPEPVTSQQQARMHTRTQAHTPHHHHTHINTYTTHMYLRINFSIYMLPDAYSQNFVNILHLRSLPKFILFQQLIFIGFHRELKRI